jgi:hypothetical protein
VWLSAGAILALGAGLLSLRVQALRPELRPPAFRADVVVAGGSPAGVAAALAAARQGMVVVLVEPRPFLGTVWTGAMLNVLDMNRLPDGRSLNGSIFKELYREIGGVTFDPRRAREALLEKLRAQPGITLLLGTHVVAPVVEIGRIIGALVKLPDGSQTMVNATITIDATDDGDVAAAAGVPFTTGRETLGLDRRAMPATLVFRVDGVDWPVVIAYAYAHRRDRQPSGVLRGYIWGFRRLMHEYRASDGRLSAHDLNIGRLLDGSALVNSLQVHDVDATVRFERRDAYARAKREVPNLIDYLRTNIPGFSRVRLVEVASELYVRESRHLEGLYTLTTHDISARTRFWDRVGAASYPIDLHQYLPGERYQYRPVRSPYTLPLRALIAARVDGLFVSSRAFSATFEAAASARVVPTTIIMGEGVGVAAAVCVTARVTPHDLAQRRELVREVQRRLLLAGAVLDF